MANIFISYSRKDEQFARRIAKSLSDLGSDVWIDVEDIPAGMKWSSAIQEGLDLCDALIAIISPDSMSSVNVEDEWQYALDQKKPVIPILYRPAKIHFQLSRIQYINFDTQDYDSAFRQLHKELSRKGVQLEPLPTLPAKSIPLQESITTSSNNVPKRPLRNLYIAAAAAVVVVALLMVVLALSQNGANLSTAQTQTAAQATLASLSEIESTASAAASPSLNPTPSVTPTRTRRPPLSASDLTNTEIAEISEAETQIALTDLAPEIATNTAMTLTADALTETAEAFTATPTPNRQQTLRATRTQGAQTETANFVLTQTQAAQVTNTLEQSTEASATRSPSATPVPTLTPAVLDCPNAPPTRLNSGMQAMITPAREGMPSRNQNIRRTPGGQIVAVIQEGTVFYIVGEPICANGFVWWFIETEDGFVRGWAAEGALPDDYFITPILPDA